MSAPIPLTPTQARAVIALVRERDFVVSQANEQIKAINDALAELARLHCAARGLEAQAHFEDAECGGVVLVIADDAVATQ